MIIKDKLDITKRIFLNKFFGVRSLISVNFAVTHRCNFKCKYCNFWKSNVKDMNTSEVLSIIEGLHKIGVKRIQFTGGEPLVRDDMGVILNFSKKLGMLTVLNTNGWFLQDKINEIGKPDLIQISLDGDKKIHDSRTRKGSYERVMKAIKLLNENKIPFGFNCVLDNENLDQVDYMFSLAKRLKCNVYFQLVQPYPYSADIKSMLPDSVTFRETIKKIIKEKKKNCYIGNSYQFLMYLLDFPNFKKINCKAGEIFARVEANGKLVPCYEDKTLNNLNLKKIKIDEAFKKLKKIKCKGCYDCCYLEYNNILSLNPRTLFNFNRILK